MISPSPPPPAIAAIVAVAITKIAPMRMPATTSGSPSGSSTWSSTCRSLMPIPRAASTTSGSTPSIAKYEFRRMGGTASTTSAAALFQKPMPRMVMPTAMSTRLGSARPTLETLTAKNSPRWRWPSHSPSGSASTSAMPSAASDSSRCSPVFCSSRPALWNMNVNASTNVPGWKLSARVMRFSPACSTA